MPNRPEVLSSLNIILSYTCILQLQLANRRVLWIRFRLWTPVINRASVRTAVTVDSMLMNWQQPCTSPTTHAGVQAISACSDVCDPGQVHVIVPSNVKV